MRYLIHNLEIQACWRLQGMLAKVVCKHEGPLYSLLLNEGVNLCVLLLFLLPLGLHAEYQRPSTLLLPNHRVLRIVAAATEVMHPWVVESPSIRNGLGDQLLASPACNILLYLLPDYY